MEREAITTINKEFILLCRQLNLFKDDEVAVDGSFFKADASKDSFYTAKKLAQKLAEQDSNDDKAGIGSLDDDPAMADKIELLKRSVVRNKPCKTNWPPQPTPNSQRLTGMPGC